MTLEDNDNVAFSAEVLSSKVTLGLGNDTITTQDFIGSIYGGAGDDLLAMGPSRTLTNTLVQGNGGNDTFNLVSISNTIINTNADDDNISINGEINSSEIYVDAKKTLSSYQGMSAAH